MLLFFNGPQHPHHPVTWKLSTDGTILIGHMILKKSFRSEPFVGSSAAILGLRVVGGQITEAGTIGAVIEKVKKGSIADTIGKLRPGDEVLEWNGRSLQGLTFEEVYDIIAESRHDPQIELIVCRVNIRPQPQLHMSPIGTTSPHLPDHRTSRLSAASPTSWSQKAAGLSMISMKRQLPQVPVGRTTGSAGTAGFGPHWDHVAAYEPAAERTSSGGSLHSHSRPHHARLPALPLPHHAFNQRRVAHFARTVSAGEWMTPPAVYSDSEVSARPSYSSEKIFYAHPIHRPASAAGKQRTRARSSAGRAVFSPEEPEFPQPRLLGDEPASSGRKSREDLRRESLEFVPRHSRRETGPVLMSEQRRDTLRFESADNEENLSETSSLISATEEKAASSSTSRGPHAVRQAHHHPAPLSSTASLGYATASSSSPVPPAPPAHNNRSQSPE